jgi:hypothetical protein
VLRTLAGRLRAGHDTRIARMRHIRDRVADERILAGLGDFALREETSSRRKPAGRSTGAKNSVRDAD